MPVKDPNHLPLFSGRRRTPRRAYRAPFELRFEGGAVQVDGLNISRSGVAGLVRGIAAVPGRGAVRVHLPDHAPVAGVVRWTRGREVGVSFTEDLANHPRLHALLARMENGGDGA